MKLTIGNVTLENNLILAPMQESRTCHFVCCAGSREQGFCVRRWSVQKLFILKIRILRA